MTRAFCLGVQRHATTDLQREARWKNLSRRSALAPTGSFPSPSSSPPSKRISLSADGCPPSTTIDTGLSSRSSISPARWRPASTSATTASKSDTWKVCIALRNCCLLIFPVLPLSYCAKRSLTACSRRDFRSSSWRSPGYFRTSMNASISPLSMNPEPSVSSVSKSRLSSLSFCVSVCHRPVISIRRSWLNLLALSTRTGAASFDSRSIVATMSGSMRLHAMAMFFAVSRLSPVSIHTLMPPERKSRMHSGTSACRRSSIAVAPRRRRPALSSMSR
mmetsp:Transcript_4962/g.11928  ORF Transcript_4962/g.11928 Transcript_4962/m.11928 type:complete len:276 (-) Transcript_4962:1360-2187(-)